MFHVCSINWRGGRGEGGKMEREKGRGGRERSKEERERKGSNEATNHMDFVPILFLFLNFSSIVLDFYRLTKIR